MAAWISAALPVAVAAASLAAVWRCHACGGHIQAPHARLHRSEPGLRCRHPVLRPSRPPACVDMKAAAAVRPVPREPAGVAVWAAVPAAGRLIMGYLPQTPSSRRGRQAHRVRAPHGLACRRTPVRGPQPGRRAIHRLAPRMLAFGALCGAQPRAAQLLRALSGSPSPAAASDC